MRRRPPRRRRPRPPQTPPATPRPARPEPRRPAVAPARPAPAGGPAAAVETGAIRSSDDARILAARAPGAARIEARDRLEDVRAATPKCGSYEQGVHRPRGSPARRATATPTPSPSKARTGATSAASRRADRSRRLRLAPFGRGEDAGLQPPSDQHDLYKTAARGPARGGDEGVAVCTDRHGVHEIRRKDDPQSSVFGRNIPSTCARHRKRGLPGAAREEGQPCGRLPAGCTARRSSAEQRVARMHPLPRSHGRRRPRAADVDKVCGTCHRRRGLLRLERAQGGDGLGRGAGVRRLPSQPQERAPRPGCSTRSAGRVDDQGDDGVRVAATFKRMITEASAEIEEAEERVDAAADP